MEKLSIFARGPLLWILFVLLHGISQTGNAYPAVNSIPAGMPLIPGSPHLAGGTLEYPDGSKPASVSFSGNMLSRPGEVIVSSSGSAGYDSGSGRWWIQCGNFPSSWSAGEVLHVDFSDGAGSVGSTDLVLSNNPADDADPVILIQSHYQITVSTQPEGLQIEVDDATYISPQVFEWEPETLHLVVIISPQPAGEGLRYVFHSWNDGGDQSHVFSVPSEDVKLHATFSVQYYLSVQSNYGNPYGEGWYDSSSVAHFGVISPDSISAGMRKVFTEWKGTGSASYTGDLHELDIGVTGPISEIALWKTQFFVATDTDPDSGGVIIPPPPGIWADSSKVLNVEAVPDTLAGYRFTNWSGGLSGSLFTEVLRINNPTTITAHFSRQRFQLITQVNPSGSGSIQVMPAGMVYPFGDPVVLTAVPIEGAVFQRWEGDISSAENPITIIMNGDKQVNAIFDLPDHESPFIVYSYPGSRGMALPVNPLFQLRLKDPVPGYGIDLSSLTFFINGTGIIENGVDVSGRVAPIIHEPDGLSIQYDPFSNFASGGEVTVRIHCEDLARPSNSIDSTFHFITGRSVFFVTQQSYMGPSGGSIVDTVSGLRLQFPQQALSDSLIILTGTAEPLPVFPDSVRSFTGNYYLGPGDLDFGRPVTLMFPFNNTLEEPWFIAHFQPGEGHWTLLQPDRLDEQTVQVVISSAGYVSQVKLFETGILDEMDMSPAPVEFDLKQNFPNPFNPETTVTYQLAAAGEVNIQVFDILGKEIVRVSRGKQNAGIHQFIWDGRDSLQRNVPGGNYILVLHAGSHQFSRKMLLIR